MNRALLAGAATAAVLTCGLASAQTTTINAGGSSLAFTPYTATFGLYTQSNPSILFSYEAVGSGKGQSGFLNNDITQFENVPAGTLTYGTIVGTTVHIGASDAYLSASQLTNPATGSYGLSSVDGPLIQLPTFGTAITQAYNYPGLNLRLTDSQICGVLSGKITTWAGLVPGASGNIEVVYRSDSSGTTFLLTQHLNAVCTSSNSSFPTLPVPITKTFASLFPNSTPPANFIGESGSGALSAYAASNKYSYTYVSPDYTSIAPMSGNKTTLQVASVLNPNNGTYYKPTVNYTELGLANPGAGSTNPTPPSTLTAAMNPLNWVPSIPTTTQGYPIVGYTTILVSQCYNDKTAGSAVIGWLKNFYGTKSYQKQETNAGFAPLTNTAASPYVTALFADFLGNSSKYNLDIDDKTVCANYTGR